MKIAAVVILYNPNENISLNIASYYNYVEKIFVFDNTEKKVSLQSVFNKLLKAEYFHDGKNEGIAKRLNTACEIAIENNFDWLLTMDQDSKFTEENIKSYFDCFNSLPQKNNTAQFGIKHFINEKSPKSCASMASDDLITSGTLLNLALYKKIGPFDENLFIDSIDHDYCIRTIISGYQNIQFTNIFLKHEMGEKVYRASIKSFFLIKKHKEIYSPLRCYYKLRNVLYLENKFRKHNLDCITRIKKDVLRQIKECLFYGRKPLKSITYLIRARKDFTKGNMGKIK